MWAHAEVYNAIITRSLHRLDMPVGKIAEHVIWLYRDGMIGLDNHGRPVPLRDRPRHVHPRAPKDAGRPAA